MPRFDITSLIILLALAGCRHDEPVYIPGAVPVSMPEYTDIEGFYLINEGNMDDNKASIDYYDYQTGEYYQYVYLSANLGVVMRLGDVGNDIGIYGDRMYAVINCSNKVEVMDKNTVERIGQVDIPNCRYIKFHGGYAYVTSYAGKVSIGSTQNGYVAKVDTATMQVVARCDVGRQPDELEIVGDRIYVANSGGYTPNNYDNTISVIDIDTFTEIERIAIAPNLHHCRADRRGVLWISARGDYYHKHSALYAYDTRKNRLVATIERPVSNMWMDGDSIYIISSEYDMINDNVAAKAFIIVDTRLMQVVSQAFITDGTDKAMNMPYGLAVNPITKDIYVTDARDYITPGRVHCYDRQGRHKWDVLAGQIPSRFVFLGNNRNEH